MAVNLIIISSIMPRKTRKEKMIAASRRQQLHFIQAKPEPIKYKNPEPAKTETGEISKNTFFFSDLRKSIIFSAIVITLEIALYFARIVK